MKKRRPISEKNEKRKRNDVCSRATNSIGEPPPITHPESGPREDGGGVPDRGNASPIPLAEYAPDTLRL
ncbi:hypothetical protein Hanom_Chr09g00816421 [Helianthus anomalus]